MHLKSLASKILFRFPTKLPQGMTEFNNYFDSICSTYKFPNNDTFKNAIANMIMHMGPNVDKKSKYFFVKALRKASANEVAFNVMNDIRKAEKLRLEEQAKKEQSSSEKPLQDN